MAKLKFDQTGERFYECGVSEVVLYVLNPTTGQYGKGVAWNGVTTISESPEGAEDNEFYADNILYLTLKSIEKWKGSITAYSSPAEFDECDGTKSIMTGSGSAATASGLYMGQQGRSKFALVYKTKKGNDQAGDDYGYVINIVYGCSAAPSSRDHATINDSPEPQELSWELTAQQQTLTGYKGFSSFKVDSNVANATKLAALVEKLYGKDPTTEGGTDGTDPEIPTPQELITMMTSAT